MVLVLISFILTFIGMEGIAWLTHKYIMHGVGWFIHKDHHEPHTKKTEKNDLFFIIFAVPSCILLVLGIMFNNSISISIGFGILAYGICYILVHDVFIHQRIKWFRNSNIPYFKALRFAHKIHHKHLNKEDGECFGMLFVPRKYYIKAKNNQTIK